MICLVCPTCQETCTKFLLHPPRRASAARLGGSQPGGGGQAPSDYVPGSNEDWERPALPGTGPRLGIRPGFRAHPGMGPHLGIRPAPNADPGRKPRRGTRPGSKRAPGSFPTWSWLTRNWCGRGRRPSCHLPSATRSPRTRFAFDLSIRHSSAAPRGTPPPTQTKRHRREQQDCFVSQWLAKQTPAGRSHIRTDPSLIHREARLLTAWGQWPRHRSKSIAQPQ